MICLVFFFGGVPCSSCYFPGVVLKLELFQSEMGKDPEASILFTEMF